MTIWDRLFKQDLEQNDSGIAINGFNALLRSYARGDVTRSQLGSIIKDGGGNAIPPEELADAVVLLDLIDAASNKEQKLEQVLDALHLVELGWITSAQAKSKLGL